MSATSKPIVSPVIHEAIKAVIVAHVGRSAIVTYRTATPSPNSGESIVFKVTGVDPTVPEDDPCHEINAEVRIMWNDV